MKIFEKLKGKKVNKKEVLVFSILAIILIFTCITVLSLAKYNYPLGDDYTYGFYGKKAWDETHSIIEVFKGSIERVKTYYMTWQGTFSAIFFMATCPSIFGERFYGLGTILLLFALVFSTIYLLNTIAKKCFNSNSKLKINIIAFLMVILSIQFVPYAVESFYWYNGAMYYTFFYSIMLMLIAFILRANNTINKKSIVIYSILIMICSILIGGANYVTALISTIIVGLFTIESFWKKRKNKFVNLASLILLVVCFAISILAPGNAYRQAGCDDSLGAVQAIVKSLKYGCNYITEWTTPIVMISILFLIPFIYSIIKNRDFTYKYPLIVTIFSYGLFSAQFTPPLYAMNNIGGTRLLDIIYYSYYWLIIINIAYYMGWLRHKIKERLKEKNISIEDVEKEISSIFIKHLGTFSIFCVTLFMIFLINSDYKNTTSINIINLFRTGEIYVYDSEMSERVMMYNDDSIKDVVVEDVTYKPSLLYCGDLSRDASDWINKAMCDYYNKDTIVMRDEQ